MLENKYNSQVIEEKIAQFWTERSDFKAEDQSTKPPFCIILPPPNVTGFLHIGHALNHTIQDVLVRWKRMSGFNTLWLPGTDHAGISTQSVVEKKLKQEGRSRLDLGREAFEAEVWKWKEEYGDRILSQMKRLGDSCDWERHTFTLDENVSCAVRKVFVALYEKGLIYRGKKLVNWSPKLQTAISDIEVDYKDVKGSMWHMRYPIKGSNEVLVVATTRPETYLGDTAVCVHPEDGRYQNLVGKKVILPLVNREIPIIKDDYVDPEFGTGVVKITPAHDFNDYEVGLRHDLEQINLLNVDGSLNENAGSYKGLHVQEARKKIVKDLDEAGFLEKVEPHKQSVGHCEKSGCVAEPYLSEQWFVKMDELAKPAIRAVESGTTEFLPELWTKTYFNWMKNIQDWCVSRQLWWGHRIPVWYCEDCNKETVTEQDPSECSHCKSKNIKQDSDVLDTWFSSALWPFSTLGWPEETEALKTFYPTDVLVTGPDIIFFWVARMMMQGLEFQKDVPFRTVYLNGLVRDSQGRKMSKSLGNSVDPVELIEDYGADALRFTLMSQLASGKDLKFSKQRLEGYRNFINKIWNATRFCLTLAKDNNFKYDASFFKEEVSNAFDMWILSRLEETVGIVNKKLESYRFSEAAQDLYHFVWNDFCDWYLEFSKSRVYGESEKEKNEALHVLCFTLDKFIKLLHPFIPFVTEEIYKYLPTRSQESLALSSYPNKENFKGELLTSWDQENVKDVDVVREVITAIRNIRGENQIKVSEALEVYSYSDEAKTLKALEKHSPSVIKMANLKSFKIEKPESLKNSAVSPVKLRERSADVVIPLEGLVDIAEEIKRVEKVLSKVEGDMKQVQGKLSNQRYIENAPEELVEEDKKNLTRLSSKKEMLNEHLSRLAVD